MCAALELLRPELRALAAYPVEDRRPGDLWLHANESPWPAAGDARGLNRYPESRPVALRQALAGYYGVPAERLLPTRGSDDAIDLLIRAFCVPGRDAVLELAPTFSMYAQFAALNAVAVRRVTLRAQRGFALEPEAVLAGRDAAVRLVFVCSPNNPTGNLQSPDDIARLCTALHGRAMVVVDEAYQEFATSPGCIPLLAAHDNLLVLRTLSKAHALAGARCGVLLGPAGLLDRLQVLLPPYPLPEPSIRAAREAMTPAALAACNRRVERLREARQWLAGALAKLPLIRRVWPSEANFLLVEMRDADAVLAGLAEAGIHLRRIRQTGLREAVRITVGSEAENQRLLAALERTNA